MCMNLEPRMDHFVAGTGRRAAVRILPGRLCTARAVTTLSPGLSRTTSSILEVRTSGQVTDQIWVICMTILFGLSVCTRVLLTHLEPELNLSVPVTSLCVALIELAIITIALWLAKKMTKPAYTECLPLQGPGATEMNEV